ncbi:glycosyltransferase family 4 protein [Macrococcoides canis]|uniref:glycosyltransferase family 4 protein n=1 Tax=Macrococcoides canis TaxID=1855823 RepID=UPI001AEC2B32|nr:glycosyltransferase family 4 protein [Macrococcus canis]QTQ08965.1 glycosyltransferase family 4 protein [Macrococcus canis]
MAKFIIVNHYATIPSLNGGTRHFDLAKELVSKGHEVTIIASSFNHLSKTDHIVYKKNEFYQVENIEGIRFIWIKTIKYKNNVERLLNIITFYKNGMKLLKKDILNRPNFVIGSTVHFLGAQLGLNISKKYNCKFIFEERDFWPQTFVDFGKISQTNPLTKILYKYERYFYKNAYLNIVLFEKAPDYLISKGVEKESILYLPNGFSKRILTNNDIPKTIENSLQANSIVYVGSHGIANELDIIIDLAKKCEDIKNLNFIFIGDGPEKNRIEKRVKDEQIGNILFHDPVPKNMIHTILKRSKFSIISIKDSPLYKFGFSMNKLLDFLYAGNPIIMLVPNKLANEFDKPGINCTLNLNLQKEFILENLMNNSVYEANKQSINKFSENYDWSILAEKFLSHPKIQKEVEKDVI